jgi:hypothetical protein
MSRRQQAWYQAFRWGDFLVAALILLLAGSLLGLAAFGGRSGAGSVVLSHEGRTVRTWDSDELQAGGEEELAFGDFHYRFEWEEGMIRFAQADCPDRVCVQTGWVGKRGSIAACVPGGLILKAVGQADPSGTDQVDVVIR